ncbi:S1 family peptidase [Rhodococcus erythropolis]|uniref:S1 family peptidase n=1 Tax=Rhodococcus erythropolis TaxID=1833 RepID=UPI0036DF5C66
MIETDSSVAQISRTSMASLYIELLFNDNVMASGTAFEYLHNGDHYLVTAWHCFTGRHPDTNKFLGEYSIEPDEVRVFHRSGMNLGQTGLGQFARVDYPLVDEALKPVFYIHPEHGKSIDIAVLPIDRSNLLGILHIPLQSSEQYPLQVADDLSIVGYPFGFDESSKLPVWARGTVASEPAVPYKNLPRFLIDSRTRKGQSGSPVVRYYAPGTLIPQTKQRAAETGVLFAGYEEPIVRFIGIYTGRVDSESDLGYVWHKTAIDEICEAKVH